MGALLGALLGGGVCFVLYQIGIIAGISGLLGCIAAYGLYKKFAGVKYSTKGLIISVILSVIILYLGLYLAWVTEFYRDFKEYGATFRDVFIQTPDILTNSAYYYETEENFIGAFAKDAIFLLLFSGIATVSNLVNNLKLIKAEKAAEQAGPQATVPENTAQE